MAKRIKRRLFGPYWVSEWLTGAILTCAFLAILVGAALFILQPTLTVQ
jgi:hypothetical protein